MKWEACFCCGYVLSFVSLFAACRWWKISTKVKKAALLDSLQETVWKSTIPQQQEQETGNKLLPHSSKTRKWEWNPALGFSPNGGNSIEMIKDSLNLLQNSLTCRYCSTKLIFALHDTCHKSAVEREIIGSSIVTQVPTRVPFLLGSCANQWHGR